MYSIDYQEVHLLLGVIRSVLKPFYKREPAQKLNIDVHLI